MNLDGDALMSMSHPKSFGSDGKLEWEVKESVSKSEQRNGWRGITDINWEGVSNSHPGGVGLRLVPISFSCESWNMTAM